jgi:hypothetical protein
MKLAKIDHAHRGQLQIAETLIAVSLMLVLALLLINAAEHIITPSSSISHLDQTATDTLITADESGMLRPVVYLFGDSRYNNEYSYYRSLLIDYLNTVLFENIGCTLVAHEINNGTIDSDYFTLIGSSSNILALEKGGEGVVANYFLGSFTSATFGQFFQQYLVQLYLWEKV